MAVQQESVADFEGINKFGSCTKTPDGKVVLVPSRYKAIVVFDPASNTWEEFGDFEGDLKFESCTTTPDGKVVLVPSCYKAIVVFDPASNTWEEFGDFEGDFKFLSCTTTSDGKVVLVPYNYTTFLILKCPTWRLEVGKKSRLEQAGELLSRLWQDRTFADAKIIAGETSGNQKIFSVHRAVLACKADFFGKCFGIGFRESQEAVLRLPHDPSVVEALLRHAYTGELAEADVVNLLPLAHQLGLKDCVMDCLRLIPSVDSSRIPCALKFLALLKEEDTAAEAAWFKLLQQLQGNEQLLGSTLIALAAGSRTAHCSPSLRSIACQTSSTDMCEASSGLPGPCDNLTTAAPLRTEVPPAGLPATSLEDRSLGFVAIGKQAASAVDLPSSLPHSQYVILHFHRAPACFEDRLRNSSFGQELRARGLSITPAWANGGKVLIPEVAPEDLQRNGHDPTYLRPWHVIARVKDLPGVFEVLRSMPYHLRPRAKSKLSLRGVLGQHSAREPMHIRPLDLKSMGSSRTSRLETTSSQHGGKGKRLYEFGNAVGWSHEANPGADCDEPAAAIDKETAADIARVCAESFFEEHLLNERMPMSVSSIAMQKNTFVHIEDGTISHSPRTLRTV